jgi:hypothetical protein
LDAPKAAVIAAHIPIPRVIALALPEAGLDPYQLLFNNSDKLVPFSLFFICIGVGLISRCRKPPNGFFDGHHRYFRRGAILATHAHN